MSPKTSLLIAITTILINASSQNTSIPTYHPTQNPTLKPSAEPTSEPTIPSLDPTINPTPLPSPHTNMINEPIINTNEVDDGKTVKQQRANSTLKLEIVILIIGAFVLSAMVFVVGICCMMQRKLRKEEEQTNRDIGDIRDIREVKSDSEMPMEEEMPKTPPRRIHVTTTSNDLVLDINANHNEEINDDHQDDDNETEETKEAEIEETKETEMEETVISDLSRMSDLEKVLNNDVLLTQVLDEVDEESNYGLSARVIGVSTNSLNVPEMLSDGEESQISELETVECHKSAFNERVSRKKKKRRSRKRKPSKKRKRKQRETRKQQENETYYE